MTAIIASTLRKKKSIEGKKIFSYFLTKIRGKIPILKVNERKAKRLGHKTKKISEKL